MTTSRGMVFDIKRFATHDGNGIRTTVFLKGCPLRCAWCQNPEGLNPKPQVLYLENNCIHCGSCVAQATSAGVRMENGRICLNRKAEENWNAIVDACPTCALRFDAREYTLEEVVEEIKKDAVFFQYGGGLTVSGGEPFLQADFLLALLQAAKQEGIHTAIETTLFTSLENVKRILPYLDQIYCDCKCYDTDMHKMYTGVSNEQILANIEYVLKSPYRDRVIVRTPLIPEMTATKDNLQKIGKFLSSCYSNVAYELLNYNPLAKAKYAYLDMEYCFEENPKLYTKEQMENFYQIVRDSGIKNLIIE